MKQKNIKLFIIVAIIVIAIIGIIISVSSPKNEKEEYVELLEDGTKINTSEKLSETKKYNGLEFTNIKLSNSSSVTNLYAEVKNITSNDMDEQLVDINVLDKEGKIITTFGGSISSLKAGETTTLNAGIVSNYTNAYDIEIVAPK